MTGLVRKSTLDMKYKIPDTIGLVTKIDFNAKVAEIENKIPDVAVSINESDFDAKLNNISNRGTLNQTK